MYLKNEHLEIELFTNNPENAICTIPKHDLDAEIIEPDGTIISSWIMHILGKTWCEHYALYEIAQIIVNEFPENRIDWKSTFLIVEKTFHDKEVKRKKDMENPDIANESVVASVLNSIQIGIEESNETTNQEISKIVDELLKRYRIIES